MVNAITYINEILASDYIEARFEYNFENEGISLVICTPTDEYKFLDMMGESILTYPVFTKDGIAARLNGTEYHAVFAKIEDKYGKSIEDLTGGAFKYE